VSDPQKRAEQVVDGMLAKDEFSRWLGVDVLQLRPSFCVCRMLVRPEMLNGFGVAHGGIAFSLADSAFAFACNTQGRIAMSIENSITYPASVHAGDLLTAVAEEESATNRLGFFRVQVTNQRDETVALFRGTVYKTNQEHP
jgi:acyl-CoA thioesterase